MENGSYDANRFIKIGTGELDSSRVRGANAGS